MALDKPVAIPLAVQPSNRGVGALATSKDAKILNGYLDKDPDTGEWWVYKRPAFVKVGTAPAALGQGVCGAQGEAFAVVNKVLYEIVWTGTTAIFGTIGTMSALSVGAVKMFKAGSAVSALTPYLVAWDADAMYVHSYGLGGVTRVTGPNLPANPGPVGMAALGGTTYALGRYGAIYGSAIFDPTDWTDTTNVISEVDPILGGYIGMETLGGYLVSFSTSGLDVYYNAGNPTGSPLSLIPSAHQDLGLLSNNALARVGSFLIWIGSSLQGGVGVFMLGTDLHAQKVSTPAVDRLLRRLPASYNIYGYTALFGGHTCFVVGPITFSGSYSGPASTAITLVYDLTTQKWYQWSWWDGSPVNFVGSMTITKPQADSSYSLSSVFLHPQEAELYSLDTNTYTDDDGQFVLDIVTPNVDFDTRFTKGAGRVDLVADQDAASIAYLRWSDDDYQNWTDFFPIDMNQDVCNMSALGSFRKRAFHVRQNANAPFRAKRLDIYVEPGTS